MAITIEYVYICPSCGEICVYPATGNYICPDCGKKYMEKMHSIGKEEET